MPSTSGLAAVHAASGGKGSVWALATLLSCLSGSVLADPPPAPVAPASNAVIPSVTVEATRERKLIEQRIGHFVSSITVNGMDQPLARWESPICPMVVGLTRSQGEFVLTRLSQIAKDAGAALDAEHCNTTNFELVVTDKPEEVVRDWFRRGAAQVNTDKGLGPLNRFIETSRPIRIWYNVRTRCTGTETGHGTTATSCSKVEQATRLRFDNGMRVRVISSCLVVVDSRQIKEITIGQMTDYIAMLGLAQIRENADPGDAPTILHLFGGPDTDRPQGLSRWDQDFLNALYHTDPRSTMRLTEISLKLREDLLP
jgi:hypothetical protein